MMVPHQGPASHVGFKHYKPQKCLTNINTKKMKLKASNRK